MPNALALLERFSLPELGMFGAVRAAAQLSVLGQRAEDVRAALEAFLDSARPPSEALALHLFLRDACLELGFQVRRTLEPLETLIQQVENHVRGAGRTGALAVDTDGKLSEETADQEEHLRTLLKGLGATEVVSFKLSNSLAELQRQCRLLAAQLDALGALPAFPKEAQLDDLLTQLLQLQKLLDVGLRPLVLEEPLPDTIPCFSVGVPTWTARFLAEAGQKLASPAMIEPAPDNPKPVTLLE